MTRLWLALTVAVACTNACSMGSAPAPTASAALDERSRQLLADTRDDDPARFIERARELGMLVDHRRGVVFDLLLQESSSEAAVATELKQRNITIREISERYHRASVYVPSPQALQQLTTATHVRRVDATLAPIRRQTSP